MAWLKAGSLVHLCAVKYPDLTGRKCAQMLFNSRGRSRRWAWPDRDRLFNTTIAFLNKHGYTITRRDVCTTFL